MSATEDRADIINLANLLTERRKELLGTITLLNQAVSSLIQTADGLLPAVATELSAGGKPAIPITYDGPSPSPDDIANAVAPSRRHCSLCDEPGHRKDTCPNAHKVARTRKEAPAKMRKARKPLSEEDKEKLRKRLVKARAARGKK